MIAVGVDTTPVAGKVSADVTSHLAGKFGLDASSAGNIVKSLLLEVMSQLSKKTNVPNDSTFTMDGILSSISSKVGGDILNAVKGMFGK